MTQTPTNALRLVPVEPTEAMLQAAYTAYTDTPSGEGLEDFHAAWSAMLSAAPASPLPGGGWQDISTAPKDGTWVLAVAKGVHPDTAEALIPAVVHWCRILEVWAEDDFGLENERGWGLTHWMPLPAAPTSEPK